MAVSFSALSHPGLRRDENEDSVCARPDLGLFAVADGLGGHAAGQVASRLAVDTLEAALGGALDPADAARAGCGPPPGDPAARLRAAIALANDRVGLLAAHRPEYLGMATTLAAVLFDPPGDSGTMAVVAHVGDSRVYRWSARGIERLTDDHSWVEEQMRAGLISASEARHHPWRNLVTRAIGGTPGLAADVRRVTLDPGDRIRSDGLSSVVADDQAAGVLAATPDDTAACEALVAAANRAGGPDNITVIVISVES
jgi:serine/threonine protein phosphatase PrpC